MDEFDDFRVDVEAVAEQREAFRLELLGKANADGSIDLEQQKELKK